ncbi:MAG: LacI family DNA-binding transcriptional regulator, partial [Pseudomonadota bacterium]
MSKARAQNPSISNVARHAGVSVATVSRVLNGVPGRFSVATGEKVRQAVAELGYRPSSAGQTLRSGESRLVAVLAANLANPAMAAMAASTEDALRQAGHVMALCDTHDDPDIQDEYLAEVEAQRASAVVMLAAVRSPGLSRLRASGMRIVFVNRDDPETSAHASVGIDNVAAGEEVARYLAGCGVREVGVIHGPLS